MPGESGTWPDETRSLFLLILRIHSEGSGPVAPPSSGAVSKVGPATVNSSAQTLPQADSHSTLFSACRLASQRLPDFFRESWLFQGEWGVGR